MKKSIILFFIVGVFSSIYAQENKLSYNFYIGASYGTSFSIGNFSDDDIMNLDAGFAQNGQKIELYGGKAINETVTITGTFRYQNFGTDKDGLINFFNNENQRPDFIGNSGNWETYSLLVGASYKVLIGSKLDFYPRAGIGPMLASNPEININSNSNPALNFIHSSKTGIGLGYEFGFGTSTNLGKRFVLLPTFTFSGGIVTIPEIETTLNDEVEIRDFKPKIHSFNLGFSLAYRFN